MLPRQNPAASALVLDTRGSRVAADRAADIGLDLAQRPDHLHLRGAAAAQHELQAALLDDRVGEEDALLDTDPGTGHAELPELGIRQGQADAVLLGVEPGRDARMQMET